MPKDMFGDVVDPSIKVGSQKWYTVPLSILAHVVLGLIDSALMGVALSAYAELFPTRVRYTGIALGFNVGAALAGGTAPYVCTWLVETSGSPLSPAWFLIGTAVVTLVTAIRMAETRGVSLRTVV